MGSLDVKLGSILPDTLQCLSQGQVQNSNTNHFSLTCTRDKAPVKSLIFYCREQAAPLGVQVDVGVIGGQTENPWEVSSEHLDTCWETGLLPVVCHLYHLLSSTPFSPMTICGDRKTNLPPPPPGLFGCDLGCSLVARLNHQGLSVLDHRRKANRT